MPRDDQAPAAAGSRAGRQAAANQPSAANRRHPVTATITTSRSGKPASGSDQRRKGYRGLADKVKVQLGTVQQTLFIPLAARARETRKKRPVLRDPKAVEIVESVDFDTAKYGRDWGGASTVLRTAIFDWWVGAFLAEHPAGTVVEIGTGLNTRFDRVDNGQVHWIDLDLPDTIELRRKFFADSGRRRMVAASVLDEDWLPAVHDRPGAVLLRGRRRVRLPGTGSGGHRAHRRAVPRRADRLRHLRPADARAAAPDGGQEEHGRAVGVVVRRPALAGVPRP